MKIDLYIQCPHCYKRLKMKQLGSWNKSPYCENCNKFFNVMIMKDEMKIVIEDKEK